MFFRKKKKPKVVALDITDQNFNEIVTNTKQPILLDFWAAWCGPCKMIGPIIDELAGEYEGRVVIGKINVDQNPNLSAHFRVRNIPTLMIIQDNKLLERFQGLVPKPNLEEILDEYIEASQNRGEEEE